MTVWQQRREKIFGKIANKLKLPLLVIVDVPSFLPGKEQERAGIEKGQFIKEMICLDTVKISLILHKVMVVLMPSYELYCLRG